MDRRRFKLQVEAVLVVYRAQRRSGDSSLPDIRRRGHAILDGLVDFVGDDSEFERELANARRELEDGRPS